MTSAFTVRRSPFTEERGRLDTQERISVEQNGSF